MCIRDRVSASICAKENRLFFNCILVSAASVDANRELADVYREMAGRLRDVYKRQGRDVGDVAGLAERAVQRVLHDGHRMQRDDLCGLAQPLLDVAAARCV